MSDYTPKAAPVKYEQLDLFAAERWQPVPGCGHRYEASSMGRIRSLNSYKGHKGNPIMLTPYRSRAGYMFVKLCYDGEKHTVGVHQVIASAFLGKCPPQHEVNHRDGNKLNNQPDNLEYITHLENIRHARRNGQWVGRKPRLTIGQVIEIRGLLASGKTQVEIAATYGVNQTTISKIKRRIGRFK